MSISGTTDYDGTYTIIAVGSTAFDVTKTYVSSQSGTWNLGGVDDPEALTDFHLQHKLSTLTYLGTNWVTTTEVAGNDDLVLSRGFYNGTEDSIDVIEVGLAWISLYGHSYGDQAYYLILRDVLSGAVTVDPGDTATVQYTLRTNVAV